jgi:hypothetical protein
VMGVKLTVILPQRYRLRIGQSQLQLISKTIYTHS